MKNTIVITGSTGAIGKAAALELAKSNTQLVLVGRNQEKMLQVKNELVKASGNENIHTVIADLSEPTAVKKAVEEIKRNYPGVNAVVNVAAAVTKNRKENSQGLEFMFATNHLGPFVLTTGLQDVLQANKGRVVTVSAPSFSKLNFDDLQSRNKFSALNNLGATKMMNLMFSYSLARKLGSSGITSTLMHPGLVKSELSNDMPSFIRFMLKTLSGKPDKAGMLISRLAIDPAFANANGKFFKVDGREIKSNAYSHDETLQEKLWSLSEELAK